MRLGLGCGQQWLSKPSCPNSEDKCKAGPDWGQGVAWQGCHGDRAGLDREEMLNEAIVWPKWSTPHKEWHIQTVIQAYCCGGPAECCKSTVYPTGSTTHHTQRVWSECMKLWHQQELQEPFPQTIQGLFRSLHWRKHCCAVSLKIVNLALKHLVLEVTGSRASHSDTGLKQGTKTQRIHFFRGISLLLNFIAVHRVEVKRYVN